MYTLFSLTLKRSDRHVTDNTRAGFAIGAVLLALVLIAAIAGAIAAGSRGSATTAQTEGNRIQASSLLNQAANIRSDIELAMSDGYSSFVLSDTDATCIGDIFCLYNTVNGYGTRPLVPDTWTTSTVSWQWGQVRVIAGGLDYGSAAPESVLILEGIRSDICHQINAIIKGHTPDIYNNSSDTADTIANAGILDSSTGLTTSIVIDRTYKAGCFQDDGADPTGDNDYSYIEIIDVK